MLNIRSLLTILGILSLCLVSIAQVCAKEIKSESQGEEMQDTVSAVYFTEEISAEGLLNVFSAFRDKVRGKVAVKIHFGEEGNKYYIKPELMRNLVILLNGTFVETNVLYKGKRHNTESHIKLAKEHGFGYAPLDILDCGGELIIPYAGKHFTEVYYGSRLDDYQTYIVISHFKGHMVSGFGGAIKNVGMGMASIRGKMVMHADENPKTLPDKCIGCELCVNECPRQAITLNPLRINPDKCISCAKCIGLCPANALRIPWGKTGEDGFMERLADYANAIMKNRTAIYINVLMDISADCDCDAHAGKPFVKDIGILASEDMLAIDLAAADLVDIAFGKEDAFGHKTSSSGRYIFQYGEKIGLGSKRYKLIRL